MTRNSLVCLGFALALSSGCEHAPTAGVGWKFEVDHPALVSAPLMVNHGASLYGALPLGSQVPPELQHVQIQTPGALLDVAPPTHAPPAEVIRNYVRPDVAIREIELLDRLARDLGELERKAGIPERLPHPRVKEERGPGNRGGIPECPPARLDPPCRD